MEAPHERHIQLAVVLRFVDIATDALGRGPRGDRRPQRLPRARRRHRHQHVPHRLRRPRRHPRGRRRRPRRRPAARRSPAFSRGALLGARGNSGVILSQMLGAIAQRIAAGGARRAQRHRRWPRRCTGPPTRATPRSGEPVEGTILTVARAAADAARGAGRPTPTARARDVFAAAARGGPRGPGPDARAAARCCATPGVVDAGGRGLSVILDAAETVLTGRRPMPVTTPHRAADASRSRVPADDLTAGRPGLRGDVPPRRRRRPDPRAAAGRWPRSATRWSSSAATGCSTSTSTSTTSAPRSRPASRPGARTGSGSPTSPSRSPRRAQQVGRDADAAAGSSPSPPAPGWPRCSPRPAPWSSRADPGAARRPASCSRRSPRCGAEEVVVLPNDPDSVRVAEIAARTAESDEGLTVAVIPTHAQVQGLAALAVHEPGRTFEQDVLRDDRDRPARPPRRRHGRRPAGDHDGRALRARRRARRRRGRLRRRRRRPVRRRDRRPRAAARRRRRAGHDRRRRRETPTAWPRACAAYVEEHHPHVDVVVYDGGQERYPLLMSVE